MTVKELRQKLYDYPDEYEVKVEDPDIAYSGWSIAKSFEEFEEDKVVMLFLIPF